MARGAPAGAARPRLQPGRAPGACGSLGLCSASRRGGGRPSVPAAGAEKAGVKRQTPPPSVAPRAAAPARARALSRLLSCRPSRLPSSPPPGRQQAGRLGHLWLAAALLAPALALAKPPVVDRCVVPGRSGGNLDLTCQLARSALANALPDRAPLALAYQPVGTGALVFNEAARNSILHQGAVVAFSTGTLVNLAQGHFGRHTPASVQWVAALALDHAVVTVHRDAPWRDLPALLAELKANPSSVSFGASGTVGTQEWVKAALLARTVGVPRQALRVVGFEGNPEAIQALRDRRVQVLNYDAAEISQQLAAGAPLRVLAVLAPKRLPGPLAGVPTAIEQRVPVQWPVLRGVYASPGFDADSAAETGQALVRGLDHPELRARLTQLGLQPLGLRGEALQREVVAQWQRLHSQSQGLGLVIDSGAPPVAAGPARRPQP